MTFVNIRAVTQDDILQVLQRCACPLRLNIRIKKFVYVLRVESKRISNVVGLPRCCSGHARATASVR